MKLAWLIGSRPRATLIRVAVLVAGAVVIFGYVLRPVRLTGISMLPTYQSGSINFANRLAFVWRQPARNATASRSQSRRRSRAVTRKADRSLTRVRRPSR